MSIAGAAVSAGLAVAALTGSRPGLGRVEPVRTAPARAPSWASRRRRGGDGLGPAAAVVELHLALAAELEAGADLVAALSRVVTTAPAELAEGVARLRDAVALGGDAVESLTGVAHAAALRPLAVCCSVALATGSRAAATVRGLAGRLREDRRSREGIAAELAGPRTTAHLLTALPAVGLLIGAVFGAHPWTFLLGSPAGWLCLAGAAALDAAGLRWMLRIARCGDLT